MTGYDNCRVLIVEDEAMIALDMESALIAAGFAVVGPFATVKTALNAIAKETPTVAVLDVNLNAEMAYPVADALRSSNVPFVWLTGHSPDTLPAVHRDHPILSKPCSPETIIDALSHVLRDARNLPS